MISEKKVVWKKQNKQTNETRSSDFWEKSSLKKSKLTNKQTKPDPVISEKKVIWKKKQQKNKKQTKPDKPTVGMGIVRI